MPNTETSRSRWPGRGSICVPATQRPRRDTSGVRGFMFLRKCRTYERNGVVRESDPCVTEHGRDQHQSLENVASVQDLNLRRTHENRVKGTCETVGVHISRHCTFTRTARSLEAGASSHGYPPEEHITAKSASRRLLERRCPRSSRRDRHTASAWLIVKSRTRRRPAPTKLTT